MLAQLRETPGILAAETDRSGTLLKLRLESADAATVARERLRAAGYEATPLDAEPRVERWYDADGARELSHEEAARLAPRLAAGFAAERGLDAPAREALEASLRRRLEASFTHDAREPRLSERMARAIDGVVEDLRAHLDAEGAAALRAYLTSRPWRAD